MAQPRLSPSPTLQLRTLYLRSAAGRISSTREPQPTSGPAFTLIRSRAERVWAVNAQVAPDCADQLDALAAQEPPLTNWREPPRFAERYQTLLGGQLVAGPAFQFPQRLPAPRGIRLIDDAALLTRHFHGWSAAEMPGRTPVAALLVDGQAVSLCACARRSDEAAEASLETAAPYRGQGLAVAVTAAWAAAVRASGRLPLYSTSWQNTASLAVTRKLQLTIYAASWSLYPLQEAFA